MGIKSVGKQAGNLVLSALPLGTEPAMASRFLFEVQGVEIGIFKEVRGLEMEVHVETINEGGQNGFAHKVPGRISWPNIVFRRGLMQSDALFQWVAQSAGSGFAKNDNSLTRQWASIIAIDTIGMPLRAWTLRDAFPVKWKGPEFSFEHSREQLEEELEIAHHGFTSKTLAIS